MASAMRSLIIGLVLAACLVADQSHAGIIKNIFHKITNTGNRTDDQVKQSVPICGSGIFSTSNEDAISPEFIFITSSASRTFGNSNNNNNRFARSPQRDRNRNYGGNSNYQSGSNANGYQPGRGSNSGGAGRGGRSESGRVSEVAREFRFNVENVTLAELEEHGFNPNAPVTFLMHGFTSGYPLQAWISAIVEAYTIDRESTGGTSTSAGPSSGYGNSGYTNSNSNSNGYSGSNGGNYGGGSGQQYGNRETYENVSPYNQGGGYRRNRRAAARGNSTTSAHSNVTMSNASETLPQSRSLSSASSSPRRGGGVGGGQSSAGLVSHNLFIINWNYAARGILYPRAVANIPKVATFATRFINDKLLDEARVDPRRIQLIGHSLGAHLAGFIGKNTRTRLGRIYGLDPAGPCFGSGVKDLLYPSSQRLAPSDADEVISISTNSALLGIDKPLGRYSVFVEGGATQPGCKPSGVLKSIGVLTWDGGDFDTVACSHSRAPNLMTYRHDQSNKEDNCELMAYACKDWDSFTKGFCGVCDKDGRESGQNNGGRARKQNNPLDPVECLRVGLDWQYPGAHSNPGGHSGSGTSSSGYNRPPATSGSGSESGYGYSGAGSTRRPNSSNYNGGGSNGSIGYGGSEYGGSSSSGSRRPYSGSSSAAYTGRNSNSGGGSSGLYPSLDRVRRAETSRRNESSSSSSSSFSSRNEYRNATTSDSQSPLDQTQTRGLFGLSSSPSGGRRDAEVEPTVMFIRTGDTQPYCTFHYQVVLELNEAFPKKDPPMAVILQDSEPTGERSRRPTSAGNSAKNEQNSLSNDEFGNVFNDRTYTHLLTSNKKLKRIDHATMIFRNGLKDGHRVLKTLHINYMSHSDPGVRQRLSSRLCPVKTDVDRPSIVGEGGNRFFFKPCDRVGQSSSSSSNYSGNSGREISNNGRENSSYGRDNENSSSSQANNYNAGSSSNYDNRGREHNASQTGNGRDRDNYGSATSGSGPGSGRHKNQQQGGVGSSNHGSSGSTYGRETSSNGGQYGSSSASSSNYGRDRDRENSNNYS